MGFDWVRDGLQQHQGARSDVSLGLLYFAHFKPNFMFRQHCRTGVPSPGFLLQGCSALEIFFSLEVELGPTFGALGASSRCYSVAAFHLFLV